MLQRLLLKIAHSLMGTIDRGRYQGAVAMLGLDRFGQPGIIGAEFQLERLPAHGEAFLDSLQLSMLLAVEIQLAVEQLVKPVFHRPLWCDENPSDDHTRYCCAKGQQEEEEDPAIVPHHRTSNRVDGASANRASNGDTGSVSRGFREASSDITRIHLAHRALEGFAVVGTVVVAVIVATGLINSLFLVGPEHVLQLGASLYGQILIAKLALFAAMLGMATINRYRLSPALGRALGSAVEAPTIGRLRKSLLIEGGIALTIFALVGWLGTLSPPVAA